jgi:hypothetical protein
VAGIPAKRATFAHVQTSLAKSSKDTALHPRATTSRIIKLGKMGKIWRLM